MPAGAPPPPQPPPPPPTPPGQPGDEPSASGPDPSRSAAGRPAERRRPGQPGSTSAGGGPVESVAASGALALDKLARCRVDPAVERVVLKGFDFPLGVYPVEETPEFEPREGFTVSFESADGGEDEEWEEWPDRYVWDVCVRAARLEPFCRALIALLPGRVFPFLDVLGQDAYRELDPYVAYELVGLERFIEGLRLYRPFLFEDGLVGFGAMTEEPFLYVFVDEHKIITLRAESTLKDRVDKILAAFDLEEVPDLAGADACVHEHRGVLEPGASADRPDLLGAEEVLEELKDLWGLSLNVDPEKNVDELGNELGVTGWRCAIRVVEDRGHVRYAEVLLTARSLGTAQDLAVEAVDELLTDEPSRAAPDDPTLDLMTADRIRPEDFSPMVRGVGGAEPDLTVEGIWASRWLE